MGSEFSLIPTDQSAEYILAIVVRHTTRLIVFIITYLVVRIVFIQIIGSGTIFNDYSSTLFTRHVYEALFILGVSVLPLTWAFRIFSRIKLSKRGNKLLWILFIIALSEDLFWHDFEFFKSQLVSIPYYWIFAIATGSDILIRAIYALVGSARTSHNSILIENKPITRVRNDKTKRSRVIVKLAEEIRASKFQSAYSIGITGEWGIGKTSFIEPLKNELNRDAIIVTFNPWLSLGRKSILQRFAETLASELSKYDYNLSSELDRYVNSLIKMEANSNTNLIESFSYIFLGENQEMSHEFSSIDQSLRKISKKIVVFIDDLDRLDAAEISETLKLIRKTANFGNTIYISCYDKIYLLQALQTLNKRNLNIALDKFFDLEIPISPINKVSLVDRIDRLFLKQHTDVITEMDASQLREYLKEYSTFFQFREVNKFLSALRLNFNIYGSRLFIQDFFFLEILKVKYPSVVQLIWRKKYEFIAENLSIATLELRIENSSLPEEEQIPVLQTYLETNETGEFSRLFLNDNDIETITRLTTKMFSGAKGHPLAIKEPDAFDAYFYHEIPESLVDEGNLELILRTGTYRDSLYFKENFNSKKEADLESILKEKNYFIGDTSTRFNFDDFFLKLLSWSKGKISVTFLNEFYDRSQPFNIKESFERLIKRDTSSTSELYARTLFLATQIRTIIYDNENNYQVQNTPKLLDKDTLVEINLSLFKKYLQLSFKFSNEVFATLYNQIETIENPSRRVVLNNRALQSFKQFITNYKEQYLDLNIRSGMRPNYDITFVFEPLTFRIFDSKEDFIEFIKSSQLPRRRKERMMEYIGMARENSNSVQEFSLEEQDLRSMPIEFGNAWADITPETKRKVRFVHSYVNWTFKNQTPPVEYLDRNDDFYDEVLPLNFQSLQIEINPGETKYWRFGFSFLQHFEKPTLIGGRHHDPNRADIHLTVGDVVNQEWALENQISLKEYHISPSKSEFTQFTRYKPSEKLKIALLPLGKNEWSIQITHKENVLGERRYNLSNFEFVVISAWCDRREFDLNTTITLIQPVSISQNE